MQLAHLSNVVIQMSRLQELDAAFGRRPEPKRPWYQRLFLWDEQVEMEHTAIFARYQDADPLQPASKSELMITSLLLLSM